MDEELRHKVDSPDYYAVTEAALAQAMQNAATIQHIQANLLSEIGNSYLFMLDYQTAIRVIAKMKNVAWVERSDAETYGQYRERFIDTLATFAGVNLDNFWALYWQYRYPQAAKLWPRMWKQRRDEIDARGAATGPAPASTDATSGPASTDATSGHEHIYATLNKTLMRYVCACGAMRTY